MFSIPFDMISTIFLFLLAGPPILTIQSMSPEVRRVALKRRIRFLIQMATPTFLFLLVTFWVIPTQMSLPPETEWIRIYFGASDFFNSTHVQTIWVIAMAMFFFISAFATIWIPYRYGQRETVIKVLQRMVVKDIKKEARLVESYLQDLIELGEQSAPGGDKELVLDALNQIVHRVTTHPQYQGDSLETLVTRLVDILTSDAKPGTAHNFNTAAGILQSIVISASAKERTVDLMYAIRALGYLSRAALSHVASGMEIENMLMNCVGSLALATSLRPDMKTQASKELFKLGMILLEEKQEFIAVHTLDTLSTLVWANQPAQGELVTDTLGLLSHFWTDGTTAREYAIEKLGQLRGALAQDLCAALDAARQHCIKTTYFQTADNLQQMINDLCSSQNK